MDLYYRNKGRFREKRDIVYADLSVSEELDGRPVGRLTVSLLTSHNPNARLPVSSDGYLGFGYPDIERAITDFNILDLMSANGMIDYKRFTLFCVCATHRNNVEPDARIVFGSHRTINPQEFQMVPLEVAHGGWRVLIVRTSVGEISHRPFSATLDSTSRLNKAAVDRALLINNAIGATQQGNIFIVDCDRLEQLPNLIIGFREVHLSLTPQQYIQKENVHGQTRCFSSIVSDPDIVTGGMVLGMAFMEHFLTMFDQQNKKVGFQPRVC
ncbi:hypothetical protein CRM22_009909 [Opisthorchis felineus]|uniref:Peptidase A1 domain-containing protein n=1 Tax=Opisthorchis felineus TaxID=147828 RepID=A0A4S2LAP2_OPIFE|nr:hypothetical protein CRM22_009909 [Opisthorchis felineus]